MKTRLAFFDFDNTLSRGDSVVPFLLYAVRKRFAPPSQLLRAVRGYLHQLRHPDQVSYSKSIAFSFIKGRRQEEIDALGRDFFREVLCPRFYHDGMSELWQLKAAGYTIVVVTASAEAYMRLLPEFLPVDAVLSTPCETMDGVYTGVFGANCRGEEKVRRIQAYLQAQDMEVDADSRAYGDSASDAPMLRLTAHPVLVNPRKKLQAAMPEASTVSWK